MGAELISIQDLMKAALTFQSSVGPSVYSSEGLQQSAIRIIPRGTSCGSEGPKVHLLRSIVLAVIRDLKAYEESPPTLMDLIKEA